VLLYVDGLYWGIQSKVMKSKKIRVHVLENMLRLAGKGINSIKVHLTHIPLTPALALPLTRADYTTGIQKVIYGLFYLTVIPAVC
jgi:hypothetical protein